MSTVGKIIIYNIPDLKDELALAQQEILQYVNDFGGGVDSFMTYEAKLEGLTVIPVEGKTIATAIFDRDSVGCTRLTLTFVNGGKLIILEQSQAGYFAVTTNP